MAQCPDCDNIVILSFPERGNGECSRCHGTGEVWALDTPLTGNNDPCHECDGSGVCVTCSGSGEIEDASENERDEGHERNDDEDSGSGSYYSSSSSSVGSYYSGSGGSYSGSDSSSSTYSPSDLVEFLWALPGLFIFGLVVWGLYQWHTGSGKPVVPPPTNSYSAYVTAEQLNLRSGPGKHFDSITQLGRGEVVTCFERQPDGGGTMWVHVRADGKDGWVSEKHLTTIAPNAQLAPPQGAVLLGKAGSIPFYANVTRLVFYEAGQNAPGVSSRDFETRFDAASARYIYWQIDLSFSAPGQRVSVPLKAAYTGPGGVVTRQAVQLDVQPDWTNAYHSAGFGAASAGWWKPGTYRVEITAAGKRVASGSFEVYDDRPIELPDEPATSTPAPRPVPHVAPQGEPPAQFDRPVLRRDQTSQPQRVSGGVLAGKAISRAQPVYPQAARIAGVEGTVVVEVTIDEQGHVIAAHALSGPPMLQNAAVQAARRWVFARTLLSGVPVQVTGTITFNFKRS